MNTTEIIQHIVVPCAFIVKEKKILLARRHDPLRSEYHNKWEFPGGGVEYGETMHQTLIREVREEIGLEVEPICLLQHIATAQQSGPDFAYQVYLVPYLCRIIGGVEHPQEEEVSEIRWVDLDEVLEYDLIGENKRVYEKLLPELKQVTSNQ